MDQSNKRIDFLTKENKILKEQIAELKDLIKVNKESIDILSTKKQKQYKLDISLPNEPDRNESNKKFLEVIKRLNNKNSDLTETVFKLQKENEELISRILILEQITQASQQHQKKTIEQMEGNLKNLNQTLVTTENKLHQNQKNKGQLDSMSGLLIKYRQVYSATEQAIKFQSKEAELIEEIEILKQQKKSLAEKSNNLLSLNVNLKNQIIQLKAKMLMPTRTFDSMGANSIKRLALYFLQAQRRILRGEDSDSDYEDDIEFIAPELLTLFPDKVQKVQSKKQKLVIPPLNLLKTRDLMFNNQKKIEAQLKRRNNMTKTERLTKLEEQLQFTRKQLTRTILQLKQIESQKEKLARINEELEERNNVLCQSYQNIEKKLRNAKISYKKYQQNADPNKACNISFLNCTFIDKKLYNQPNVKNPKQMKFTEQEQLLTGKEQFEIQANHLAYQVSKLPYIKNIQSKQFKPKRHEQVQLKRSYSNPLLYVEQRKELMYYDLKKQSKLPDVRHHDETCFQRMGDYQEKSKFEDLDDVQL